MISSHLLACFSLLLGEIYSRMVQRLTSIFFIILANVILLAHSVVHHHHHDNQVCFESTHCETHNLPANDHDGDHHPQNDDGCCVLQDVVAIQNSEIRQDVKHLFYIDLQKVFAGYQFLLADNAIHKTPFIYIASFRQKQCSLHYLKVVRRGFGLRAPPTA